jgi:hypothetical protein
VTVTFGATVLQHTAKTPSVSYVDIDTTPVALLSEFMQDHVLEIGLKRGRLEVETQTRRVRAGADKMKRQMRRGLGDDAYELPEGALSATPGPGSTGAKVAAQLQRRPVESRVTK